MFLLFLQLQSCFRIFFHFPVFSFRLLYIFYFKNRKDTWRDGARRTVYFVRSFSISFYNGMFRDSTWRLVNTEVARMSRVEIKQTILRIFCDIF